jgi:hypothetical protein
MSAKHENGRIARWALAAQEYWPFEIHYRPGKSNSNADALSRASEVPTKAESKNRPRGSTSETTIRPEKLAITRQQASTEPTEAPAAESKPKKRTIGAEPNSEIELSKEELAREQREDEKTAL